jgi:hypothetical protein
VTCQNLSYNSSLYFQRPNAKELLKHRFIKNARKSPKLLERIRERPKYQVKEDEEIPTNGPKAPAESSGTVRVAKDERGQGTSGTRLDKWLDKWSILGISSLFLVRQNLKNLELQFSGKNCQKCGVGL